MSEQYDPSLIAQVRLLIDDTQGEQVFSDDELVFSDDEIAQFLDLNAGSVLRGAAQALLMLAGSEARLGKKIRTQDLQTDGPAVAAELRALAKELRQQAAEQEAAGPDAAFFDVVEYPPTRARIELTEPLRW